MTNNMKTLNIYMGYSRSKGSQEAAILIFATTAREAKKLAWDYDCGMITDEWIDLAIRAMNDSPWLYEEAEPDKLRDGIPHVIESPTTCKRCELWGAQLFDGYCEYCCQENEDDANYAEVKNG